MEEKDMIPIMLEEYRALRAEILQTISERFRILAFGLAGMGVLIVFGGGLFSTLADDSTYAVVVGADIRTWVLAVVVPLVAILVYVSWLSEVQRGRRASQYLWGVERTINALSGKILHHWEESIRLRKSAVGGLFTGHYWFTGGAIGLIAAVSSYFGKEMYDGASVTLEVVWWVGCAVWGIAVFYWNQKFERFDQELEGWPESLDPSAHERWPRKDSDRLTVNRTNVSNE